MIELVEEQVEQKPAKKPAKKSASTAAVAPKTPRAKKVAGATVAEGQPEIAAEAPEQS